MIKFVIAVVAAILLAVFTIQNIEQVEVQLPFVQQLMPSVKLLPIMVPPTTAAPEVGRVVAEQARKLNINVAFLGSSDLTHYGPRYQFVPKGVGPDVE